MNGTNPSARNEAAERPISPWIGRRLTPNSSSSGSELSPDQVFDREWAIALLAKVILRLQQECEKEGRGKQFAELKGFLTLDNSASNPRQAAMNLGMEEGAVRVAIHRLRKRYRTLLRDEITQTLSDPAQLEEELRALFSAFSA